MIVARVGSAHAAFGDACGAARSGSSIIESTIAPVFPLFLCGIIETGVTSGESTLYYATVDTPGMVRMDSGPAA
jgi:hypothetical protein